MRTTEIQIKGAFTFAKDLACFPLSAKKPKRIKWLAEKEIYSVVTNEGERTMTPVTLKKVEDSPTYLMDVITGTLYSPKSKLCLTSDHLKILSYKIDPDHGKKIIDMKVEGGDLNDS